MKAGVAAEAEAMRWLRCLLEVEVGEEEVVYPLAFQVEEVAIHRYFHLHFLLPEQQEQP